MKLIISFFLALFVGCQVQDQIMNGCDTPTMFVIRYGDNWEDETYPTAMKYFEQTKKYHEGNIRQIIYFCSDRQLQAYLDDRYPLLELDKGVLQ